MGGVYIPFWTFDAFVRSQWSAERGWYYYETETYTETVDGRSETRTRQVQRTRWEGASGWRQDTYDDVLVCAGKGLPGNLRGPAPLPVVRHEGASSRTSRSSSRAGRRSRTPPSI